MSSKDMKYLNESFRKRRKTPPLFIVVYHISFFLPHHRGAFTQFLQTLL